MGIFSKNIGLDLGTSNTLLYKKGAGIILNEPSVVAVDKLTANVVAIGTLANEMIGRTPDNIVAHRPIKDGVIADFDLSQVMIRQFIKEALGKSIFKPYVYVNVGTNITEVEKRAVEEAIVTAGAKSVVFVDEPMAAAIGSGLPIHEATGTMIVNIGGGTTETAVISLSGIVSSKSIKVAGEALDSSIINYIKKEHSLNIGEKMAEDIKINIGTVVDNEENLKYIARGRDVSTGLPKQVEVSSGEIKEAMSENINLIMDSIMSTLEHTPPELASDVMERGIVLSGGGALIKGIDRLIFQKLKIKANICENPLLSVATGIGMFMDKTNNN